MIAIITFKKYANCLFIFFFLKWKQSKYTQQRLHMPDVSMVWARRQGGRTKDKRAPALHCPLAFFSFHCILPQILTTLSNVKAFRRQTSSKTLGIGTIYTLAACGWLTEVKDVWTVRTMRRQRSTMTERSDTQHSRTECCFRLLRAARLSLIYLQSLTT